MTITMKVAVAASAVLLAAAFALHWLARSNDAGGYQRGAADIRQIRQLATEWSVETALVRTAPLRDYDALAAFIPEAARLKAALIETVRSTPAMPERLANDVYAFASALDAKEERIERFKTANSVIRNSVRYLPHAATRIVQSSTDTELVQDVTALSDGLGEYVASPTDAAKGRLKAILDRLVDRPEALSEDQARALSNFLAHARILLDRQGPTERIFRQATSNEVSDLASELVADFDSQSASLARRADLFMTGIWVAAVGLLLVWVFAITVRSRPARSAADDATDGVAVLPAPAAEVAANGTRVPHEHLDNAERRLMSHRILTTVVSSDIAAALRGLPTDNGTDTTTDMERVAALAERLATASSAQDTRYALVDLKDCADAALRATGADKGATVVRELGDAPQVFASEAELCLMLEQVVDNGLYAIREKGLDRDEGEIRIETTGDGNDALVTVIDNGVGMSLEDRRRMFEPFAGSRPDRPGVGLAIAQHIARKYGGRMGVGSYEGGGTVLRISLPGMSE